MKIFATGRSLQIIEKEDLVSGTVKDYTASFAFDGFWEGWTPRAVFENITTGVAKEQILAHDGSCLIPWEVLEPGSLRVGIYGVMDDKVRPTIYSDRMTVREGTKASESAKEPTPGIYEQLLASIEDNAITGAELDENNHLIFTTKGGETIDAGELPMDEAITVNAPYIGENGNWYLWDPKTDGYIDSGVNAEGTDGYTPVKGVDYFTEEDIKSLGIDDKAEKDHTHTAAEVGALPDTTVIPSKVSELDNDSGYLTEHQDISGKADKDYVDEQTEIIKSDVDGLQKQINEEAHFKGYLSTNAKIQALEATPNDFAYSAESGTKWIYDEVEGWQDTSSPVPDQLTPASERTPLMDGEAAAGTEEAYARGDHRHPTDTTRASAAELNDLKNVKADKSEVKSLNDAVQIAIDDASAARNIAYENSEKIGDIETALDNIIAIQNTLIGGDSV